MPGHRRFSSPDLLAWTSELYLPLLAAAAYFAAAEAAFLIGTLSDRIFAPFWPPNVVLLCVLLLAPASRWWLYFVTIFIVHALAEARVGMPVSQMLIALATNWSVAVIGAGLLRAVIPTRPWLGSLRNAALFVLIAAGIAPAIAAFGGAFVQIAGGQPIEEYWEHWGHWYTANALACLTLGPLVLSWFGEADHDWLLKPARWSLEAIIVALLLILGCMFVFNALKAAPSAFLPALLYLPLPLILWMAFRFGVRGASIAILTVTVVLVSQTLRGPSPFAMADIETNVLALQLFLTGLSIPVLLLGAAVDETAATQAATRRLAGSLLRAHDEERRRIARGLHESTAQDLVAATMLASQMQKESPDKADLLAKHSELLQRSISNLRGMSYLLHPPLLDEAGLPLALRSYITEFSQRSGIRIDADLHDDIGRLPADVELALFRVTQEALSNVRRHTESPSARILLSREIDAGEDSIVLTIQNAEESTPRLATLASRLLRRDHLDPLRGTGLASIRERLHQIGGKLELRSAGGLTHVRAIVPSALN